MKRLYLLRHGEAGSSPDKKDKTRPLTPKGMADSLALGPVMLAKHYTPEIVLCSSAVRTQKTAQNILQAFDHDIPVKTMDELYNAPRDKLLSTAQDSESKYHDVLIVAHNPGIHELAVTLAAHGANSVFNRLMTSGFPPGTLVVLECPCTEWYLVQPGENTIIDIMEPIDYNAPARPTRWM